MDILVILCGISAVFVTLIAIEAIIKRKKTKAFNRYIWFLVMGAFWVIIGTFETSSLRNIPSINIFLSKLDFIFASLIAYFLSLFAIHFPTENKRLTIKSELLLFIPIGSVILLTIFGKIFYYQNSGLVYNILLFIIYFLTIAIYFFPITFYNLITKYKHSQGVAHIQLQYIILGLLVAITIGLVLSFEFAINRSNSTLFSIAYIACIVYAAATSYAMIKYRFMDIRVIVRRGVIYGISLILVLAIYTYLALALKSTIEQSWNINTTWTAIILIALVALGFPPLKRLVEKIVDTTFKGRQSIDLAVQEVRDAVAKKTDAQELADAVAKNIQGYLNANAVKIFLLERTKGCFVHSPDAMQREELHEDSSDLARLALVKPDVIIRDEIPHLIEEGKGNGNLQRAEHDMKKRHITAYVPLRTEDEVIGIIAVGDRTGSDAYTVQDVQYLEHVRDQVTAPLANALQYRDAMERIRLQMHGEASS